MIKVILRTPRPCQGPPDPEGWRIASDEAEAISNPATLSPGLPLLPSRSPLCCAILIILLIEESWALDQNYWFCNSPKHITS